jgi:hypothetical protein
LIDIGKPLNILNTGSHRVVAEIEELHIVNSEDGAGSFCFRSAFRLYALESHAGVFPKLLAFAFFSKGETYDSNLHALACVQRDCATSAPDEICRMCAYYEACLWPFHCLFPPSSDLNLSGFD